MSEYASSDPDYVQILLSQPTPILKDLCSYYGLAFSYPTVDPIRDYPLVLELDTRCWLFETIHSCLLNKFDDDSIRYRFWVYIPWSVNECMRSFRSFMGFFYVRIEYPKYGTCVDLFHGINYLPLGPFIRGDVGEGILGRIMVKGKEKFFTAFESISPDIPCISRDNILTTTRYRKYLTRCYRSYEQDHSQDHSQSQVTTTRLCGASSYDGKRPLDNRARRSICCVFKSYVTTEHVPVNIVRGYISGAPVPITIVSTYAPHKECTILGERDEHFLARYYPRLASACRMVRMQLESCIAGYKGVSNTNSYAYKTVKQPSHVFMDHVQKQL